MEEKYKYASVCSGIEVAHLALSPLGFCPLWFSENALFPSKVLQYHYPQIPNLGDMQYLPDKILSGEIETPDLFCGGTPCNSYSLLGKRKGLQDERGGLSLTFIDIADCIDEARIRKNEKGVLILWENVEGILNDKGNAFGIFLNKLVGLKELENVKRWSTAGIAKGNKRTAVWRVLDASYFGLPQHRKRVFVLASSNSDWDVANMLIETNDYPLVSPQGRKRNYTSIIKKENGKVLEIFSEHSNCLHSCYGGKYNDTTANSGTLIVSENGHLRRLTPLECERLMGLTDNYTLIPNIKGDLQRYKALGNAWPKNVISWIGARMNKTFSESFIQYMNPTMENGNGKLYLLEKNLQVKENLFLNVSCSPYDYRYSNMFDILEPNVSQKYFLSISVCKGILRRKAERGNRMNPRLESLMKSYIQSSEKDDRENSLLAQMGKNIKYLRKLNHLTQSELAEKTGLNRLYILAIEKGKENISVLNLQKIANALGVHLAELFQ